MNFKRLTYLFISTLTFVGLLGSCGTSSSNRPDTETPDVPGDTSKPDKPIIPTKEYGCFFKSYYHGEELFDSALSISTIYESENLDGVTFNIFKRRDNIFTYTFEDTSISPSNPFIITNKSFTKSALISQYQSYTIEEDKMYNKYYFELVAPNGEVIDSLGNKGFEFELAVNQTLVRLKEFSKPSPKFRFLDFVRVVNENDKFKMEPNFTLDEFLTGPRLDEELYGNMNFSSNGLATGGYCEVSLARHGLGDGDTTQFDWPSSAGIPNGRDYRVRYLLINTPEVDHTGEGSNIKEQPFGEEAKKFNNDRLRNASIIVQSDKGGQLHETYGRTLGYVWYTNKSNPSIEDYRLLNYELVLAGLARIDIRDENSTSMRFNFVTYQTYIRYAFELAKEKGIKIHGETDPNFDYDAN